jgi:uncharacterized membrane protein
MSTQQAPQHGAPRRYTSATLTGGVALAALLFGVAGVAEFLGAETGSGEMTDFAAIVDGLVAFTPWAWATAGAYAVLVTPVVGLLVTAAEYWSVDDRRTVLLAFAVLGVLCVSVLVAILR